MTTPMVIASGSDLSAVVSDEERFRDWYDATLPQVYRYLAARCAGDDVLAEELTQQTFVEAVRHHDRFDGRADVVTWLCAIGRNKLVDHYRRNSRETRRHGRLIGASTGGADLGRGSKRATPWRPPSGCCPRTSASPSSSTTWMA